MEILVKQTLIKEQTKHARRLRRSLGTVSILQKIKIFNSKIQ